MQFYRFALFVQEECKQLSNQQLIKETDRSNWRQIQPTHNKQYRTIKKIIQQRKQQFDFGFDLNARRNKPFDLYWNIIETRRSTIYRSRHIQKPFWQNKISLRSYF